MATSRRDSAPRLSAAATAPAGPEEFEPNKVQVLLAVQIPLSAP